ncbi:exonuclease domain-containing protein [Caballeronia sp. LZ062]|uniref:exonuclease domain-containing protein n=1 Tax=unclassified Caballeronia TaxID=2646786 RepID=UPI0028583E65|nr:MULTISPECIES: exonuclease domain-containing protein [unclassified Caballeronia]MDR5853932.1 exonuclease domain-containing protein [Caballeronia sp. LZ050]MDR5871537.1 exonuclease domain-containing protein [Caballeronia sp. LZ062]
MHLPPPPDFTLPSAPLIFVDLETTGGTFGVDRITEIGIVEVGPHGVSQWTSLVNPERSIPAFVQQLTGIDDAMVRHAPTFAELAAGLLERMDGRLFVAHNAHFDHSFLKGEFKRIGMRFMPDVLCTVQLSRAVYPAETRHGLDALVERHALVPAARHRALADADLLWQFWQHLHRAHAPEILRAHVERVTRRFRLAAQIDEDTIERIPAGCGVYTFFGDDDAPLYVGRSVRLRQRVRSHLTGPRRSAKDLRLAALVRRVEWKATGGEIGAMLAEAKMIATLRPSLNRAPKSRAGDARSMPWPYAGAIAIEERDAATGQRAWHVIDNWQYFGTADALPQARELRANGQPASFDLAIYRILGERLSRGLAVTPLRQDALAAAVSSPQPTAPTPPAHTCDSARASGAFIDES